MINYETIRLKVFNIERKLLANFRNKKLKNKKFTIISNNCWAGMIYESYNLQKQTPTIGSFFMAEDYIKFLSNLKEYIQCDLKFISPKDSKWKNCELLKNDENFGNYPIGVLEYEGKRIEIFFVHYKNEKEAKLKWERRCQRIEWNNLIIKFNDQNGCNYKNLKDFLELQYENKLFFTINKEYLKEKSNVIYYIHQFSKTTSVLTSYEPYGHNKYINFEDLINNL